jgi:hypothetical protein
LDASLKALFYLPLRDSDGRDLAGEIEALEAELFIRFSGWTFQGYVKGAYRMADGTQASDESAAYVVVCDDSRIDEVVQLLQEFKRKASQETIYLEIQRDVEVRFL